MSVLWYLTKDGDRTLLALHSRHYSRRRTRTSHTIAQMVGPGETIVLRTRKGDAGFVWRRFIDDSGERGINCAFFRNEGPARSSDLIRQADAIADFAWPCARHYTYVDPEKVRSANPGYCFIAAGWKRKHRLTDDGVRVPYLTGSGKQVLYLEPHPTEGARS